MNNMQGQHQQQPNPNSGVTDIQELMRMGVNSNNSDVSAVDEILAEIGSEKQQQLQVQNFQFPLTLDIFVGNKVALKTSILQI